MTISFALVGYNTADIQQIKLSDPDGVTNGIGWGSETFVLWEGLPTPVIGSSFFFYDPSMNPDATETDYYWGDDQGYKVTYPIESMQGVVINTPVAGLKIEIEAPYDLSK